MLARPPMARLLRSGWGRIAVIAWSALAVAFAVTARTSGSPHAADHVLLRAYAPLVLPLLTYAVAGTVIGTRSLSFSAAPLVALGARPAQVTAVTMLVASAACAFSGGLLAVVVDMISHASADPPLGRDAIACAYAGGLGGGAYASLFAFGASFGKRGGGRPLLLVLDWVLGAGDGPAALVTPRAHLRNLFGGTAPLELSGRASALALLVIGLLCAAIGIRRVRRAS